MSTPKERPNCQRPEPAKGEDLQEIKLGLPQVWTGHKYPYKKIGRDNDQPEARTKTYRSDHKELREPKNVRLACDSAHGLRRDGSFNQESVHQMTRLISSPDLTGLRSFRDPNQWAGSLMICAPYFLLSKGLLKSTSRRHFFELTGPYQSKICIISRCDVTHCRKLCQFFITVRPWCCPHLPPAVKIEGTCSRQWAKINCGLNLCLPFVEGQ
ncbi:hypothetical protein J6590_070915 [Homalodisca vitripennis]|nr:hypothetical protein J6590_070915 [Homalodisca vitripennis]